MKSILVALDGTPAATAARAITLGLAKAHRARVTGVGILDVGFLTAPEPEPLGGAYYKHEADLKRLKRANEELAELVRSFEAECSRLHLDGHGVALEGEPLKEVIAAADVHDLIVLGRDTAFHSDPRPRISATVERLLKSSPRPVVVTPPSTDRISPVVIAYDGSIASARALQMFVLLGMAATSKLHVVSVQPGDEAARAVTRRAAGYLELYGVPAELHGIASSVNPADILLAETRSLSAGMLVMGAFGHRGWREALLGSCTAKLLAECPTSMFVYH